MKKKKKNQDMLELHCSTCGRFLGFYYIIVGAISIFCPRCKNFTQVCYYPEENSGVDTK